MNMLKKAFMAVLIVSFLCLQLPGLALAGQSYRVAKTGQAGITKNPPSMLATPEVAIPVVKEKGNTALKIIGGLLLVGGIGALAAGGGGGGGGGGGTTPPSTGDVTVTW